MGAKGTLTIATSPGEDENLERRISLVSVTAEVLRRRLDIGVDIGIQGSRDSLSLPREPRCHVGGMCQCSRTAKTSSRVVLSGDAVFIALATTTGCVWVVNKPPTSRVSKTMK